MTHYGKSDWGLILAVAAGVAVSLTAGLYWVGGPALLVLMLCLYPQKYRTAARGLVVETGLIRRFIPYDAITFVAPCTGVSSALAMDGVSIRYGARSELRIAPADAAAFIADLAAHAPHLSRRDRGWTVLFA